jgi:hypothetical protein
LELGRKNYLWDRANCIKRRLINLTLRKYFLGDFTNGDERGGMCSMHSRDEKSVRNRDRAILKEEVP